VVHEDAAVSVQHCRKDLNSCFVNGHRCLVFEQEFWSPIVAICRPVILIRRSSSFVFVVDVVETNSRNNRTIVKLHEQLSMLEKGLGFSADKAVKEVRRSKILSVGSARQTDGRVFVRGSNG